MPLASIKLTIVLFSLAIFLVLAGTVAQVDKDIWQVVHQYFRTWVATINIGAFMPRGWSVPGSQNYVDNPIVQWLASHSFYYPGGWTIGAVMALNLIAAHTVRFKIQASGQRLILGVLAIAAAAGFTCLVILSGNNVGAAGEGTWLPWSTLWFFIKIGLAIAVGTGIVGLATLNSQRRAEWWALAAATVLGAGVLTLLLVVGDLGNDASVMRILWQLLKGAGAGAALLAACWIVFKKRAGIVVIHLGVGLMMFNELYVGLSAVESQLRLHEGQSRNYTEDIRSVELALIDRSDAREDQTVVIPKRLLDGDATIHDARLPFDVRVDQYFDNADLRDIGPNEKSPATAGVGLTQVPVARATNAGADAESGVDLPAAFVTLYQPGTNQKVGTYLVSAGQSEPDQIEANGKKYDLALRFKRLYKPYAVQLLEVRKDDYMGTSIARNYSSDIHIVDRDLNTDFKKHIKMNDPLRFAGDTFYQSGFQQVGDTKFTILSVVSNDVWMIPYVGCMIVVVGLLAHFLMTLTRFIRRQIGQSNSIDQDEPAEAVLLPNGRGHELSPEKSAWTLAGDYAPWVAVALLVGWCLSHAIPPSTPTDAPNYYEFGKLPVMYEGRIKPFDTLARNAMRAISDRQTFVDLEKETRPAVRWLLDVATRPEYAKQYQIVKIDSPELLSLLGLERREGYRYSMHELAPHWDDLLKQIELAHNSEKAQQTPLQRKVLELEERLKTYVGMQTAFRPIDIPAMPTPEELDKNSEETQQRLAELKDVLSNQLPQLYSELEHNQAPLAVPVESKDGTQWVPYAAAVDQNEVQVKFRHREPNRATVAMQSIFDAYKNHDVPSFNAAVAEYRARIDVAPPKPVNPDKVAFEAFFNHFEPFYYGIYLYVIAFVLACAGFMMWAFGRGEILNRTAFWLILATFALHTAALIGRIYISGRPPVTNLYSAAVFVGWGGVLLGLILERVFKLGVGNVIAGAAGFASLLIAHLLASSGDTFTVLVAVLDTQFWLATHVVCVTLGYATTFVAGLLGVSYIVLGVFTPVLEVKATRDWTVGKALATMIYGVVCFALLFSFFGTVLGGLWADDSWGRFWGWDPKENGALIIVIWNALVLHARWDGMVKDRGLALLAVVGNIAVGWSMFGVNELGAGLHSYGFTEGVVPALLTVIGAHLALIAIGSLPKRLWLSNRLTA